MEFTCEFDDIDGNLAVETIEGRCIACVTRSLFLLLLPLLAACRDLVISVECGLRVIWFENYLKQLDLLSKLSSKGKNFLFTEREIKKNVEMPVKCENSTVSLTLNS